MVDAPEVLTSRVIGSAMDVHRAWVFIIQGMLVRLVLGRS